MKTRMIFPSFYGIVFYGIATSLYLEPLEMAFNALLPSTQEVHFVVGSHS